MAIRTRIATTALKKTIPVQSCFFYHSTAIYRSILRFPRSTTILFLSGLFPEPNASAAGVRTKSLLELLSQTEGVDQIHYGTGAKPNHESTTKDSQKDLEKLGVQFHYVPPNNSVGMLEFLHKSSAFSKENDVLVLMDRFYAEEAYSFHIHQHLPHAAIVLDMQDMHSLRWHRQSIVEERHGRNEGDENDPLSNLSLLDYPSANETSLQRELASIYRSDLTLVCSPVELSLLNRTYHVPKEKICLVSFFMDASKTECRRPFYQRKDFVFIGGFRHDPNVDAIRQMRHLWPRIRDKVWKASGKLANFHVYGPFCPPSLRQECHDTSNGFHMLGFAQEAVDKLLSRYRVLLAPLRFGAGIKGKIIDAWSSGTPVVTTPIGSEGMRGMNQIRSDWGGLVAYNSDEFVQNASILYTDERTWLRGQNNGDALLLELYSKHNWENVVSRLIDLMERLESRRESDYSRGVLWHHTVRSTKYFSRWIESKERKT